MARSTRNQPFCWQEKKILRLFRKLFTGNELSKFRNLYGTITEMDSDFNNQDIKFYTKTISTYSGLSEDWIPKGLKKLQELKIIEIVEDRVNGKFKGKRLIFTPENIEESIIDTITQKVGNGKITNGFLESSEDISLLEDSIYQEEINNIKGTLSNDKTHTIRYNSKEEFLNRTNYAEETDKYKVCDYIYSYFQDKLSCNHYILNNEQLEKVREGIDLILQTVEKYPQLEDLLERYFNLDRQYYSIQDFTNLNTLSYLLSKTGICEISERFDADGKWEGVV